MIKRLAHFLKLILGKANLILEIAIKKKNDMILYYINFMCSKYLNYIIIKLYTKI